MKKRSLYLHSDSDLRDSVAHFNSNLNKLGYSVLISYMNGTSSSHGWIFWNENTIKNICYLNRGTSNTFMFSQEVTEKLIFGFNKSGALMATQKRVQADLLAYFGTEFKKEEMVFEGGIVETLQELCNYLANALQVVDKRFTNALQMLDKYSHHKSMNNNDSKIQIKLKEIKEKESNVCLAQAQKTEDFEVYKNHDFVGESEEQKKDLDEIYESLSDQEDGNKKILEVVAPSKTPTAKEVENYCKATTKTFPFPFDAEKWVNHWEAKKWVDKFNRSFDWKLKLIDMAEDSRFIIKAEKTQTTKEPFKSFAEQKTDHEDCEALRFRYGIIKHKHSTYEELKEIDRLARAEKAKNREQPSQETTNKLLGSIYANLIQTY